MQTLVKTCPGCVSVSLRNLVQAALVVTLEVPALPPSPALRAFSSGPFARPRPRAWREPKASALEAVEKDIPGQSGQVNSASKLGALRLGAT